MRELMRAITNLTSFGVCVQRRSFLFEMAEERRAMTRSKLGSGEAAVPAREPRIRIDGLASLPLPLLRDFWHPG